MSSQQTSKRQSKMKQIIVDTREKPRAIKTIIKYFDSSGVEHIHKKLDVGDYMNPDNMNISVDRKQNLGEVANNLTNDNGRFMREVRRAHESGLKLIILVEHGEQIKRLTDVCGWRNPIRVKHGAAIEGRDLMDRMHRVSVMYGVEWRFCAKGKTGEEIIKILDREV